MILELILNMFAYKRVFFWKEYGLHSWSFFFSIKETGKVNKLNKPSDLCEILECDVWN